MKIIVTTSNKYLHILPIFCHLFNKFWSPKQQVEIVGYNKPTFDLPSNFHFVSLGSQIEGDQKSFTRDLRKYFARQEKFFIWCMEDTFLKAPVDFTSLNLLKNITEEISDVGRVNLSGEVVKQDHEINKTIYHPHTKHNYTLYNNTKYSLYRLSTQPSIWNKHFVLQYMSEDMTPWEFECQADHAVDEFKILGFDKNDAPLRHNEGVRKHNIYLYDFNGISEEVINEMKQLNLITNG